MIVAVDTTTAPTGQVAPETLDLIAALVRPASPARQLVLIGREEQYQPLRDAAYGLATVLALESPGPGRWQVEDYRRRKRAVLASHGVQLLHVAGGGPLDVLAVGLPVVLSVDDLAHRATPERFSAVERGRRETTWTASAFRADTVVVPAEAVRDALRRQLGVDPAKVFVAPPDLLLPGLTAAYDRATRSPLMRKAA